MANPDVCDSFTARRGERVNFSNSTGKACSLEQGPTVWPFTDGPPLPVPTTGATTHIAVGTGVYTYDAKCCGDIESQKSVTVP